jgi:hypothetical protein
MQLIELNGPFSITMLDCWRISSISAFHATFDDFNLLKPVVWESPQNPPSLRDTGQCAVVKIWNE